MNGDLKQTVTVEEDAVNIKGLALTKIHITFGLRDETPDHPVSPAAKQGLAMIEKIYGPDGMTLYTAVFGKRILTVFGSDATILESAVAAAQADTDILSNNATISAVKDQIVKNPVAVAYFPLAKFVELAQTMIGGTGPAPRRPGAECRGRALQRRHHRQHPHRGIPRADRRYHQHHGSRHAHEAGDARRRDAADAAVRGDWLSGQWSAVTGQKKLRAPRFSRGLFVWWRQGVQGWVVAGV